MDNTTLAALLGRLGQGQFWHKVVGDPEAPPDETPIYTEPRLPLDFPVRPSGVGRGDVLMVSRIKVGKLMFVGEVLVDTPHEVTPSEIEAEPWRKDWPWRFEVGNLAPEFGGEWCDQGLSLVTLAGEYSRSDEIRPSSIKYTQDKMRLPQGFAEFVLRKIMSLT